MDAGAAGSGWRHVPVVSTVVVYFPLGRIVVTVTPGAPKPQIKGLVRCRTAWSPKTAERLMARALAKSAAAATSRSMVTVQMHIN